MSTSFEAPPQISSLRNSSRIRQIWPGMLIVLGLTFPPGAASAAVVIQCTGTETAVFTPGLSMTPRSTRIDLTHDLSACTGFSDPQVTSAFDAVSVVITASCLETPTIWPDQERVFTWNTGDTSTFSFDLTIARVGAQQILVETGEIIDGLFEGATAVLVITSLTANVLDCLGPAGVTETSGSMLLIITLAE